MLSDLERKIIELWKLNMTTTAIAAEIGITKNMVCGRIYRMRKKGIDINQRHFVSTFGGLIGKKKVVIRRRPLFTDPIPAPVVEKVKEEKPVVVVKEPELAKPLNIRFWQLKNNSCRYVMNDGPAETFIFCGAPKERGPYCEAHASICYIVPEKRSAPKKLYR